MDICILKRSAAAQFRKLLAECRQVPIAKRRAMQWASEGERRHDGRWHADEHQIRYRPMAIKADQNLDASEYQNERHRDKCQPHAQAVVLLRHNQSQLA